MEDPAERKSKKTTGKAYACQAESAATLSTSCPPSQPHDRKIPLAASAQASRPDPVRRAHTRVHSPVSARQSCGSAARSPCQASGLPRPTPGRCSGAGWSCPLPGSRSGVLAWQCRSPPLTNKRQCSLRNRCLCSADGTAPATHLRPAFPAQSTFVVPRIPPDATTRASCHCQPGLQPRPQAGSCCGTMLSSTVRRGLHSGELGPRDAGDARIYSIPNFLH